MCRFRYRFRQSMRQRIKERLEYSITACCCCCWRRWRRWQQRYCKTWNVRAKLVCIFFIYACILFEFVCRIYCDAFSCRDLLKNLFGLGTAGKSLSLAKHKYMQKKNEKKTLSEQKLQKNVCVRVCERAIHFTLGIQIKRTRTHTHAKDLVILLHVKFINILPFSLPFSFYSVHFNVIRNECVCVYVQYKYSEYALLFSAKTKPKQTTKAEQKANNQQCHFIVKQLMRCR